MNAFLELLGKLKEIKLFAKFFSNNQKNITNINIETLILNNNSTDEPLSIDNEKRLLLNMGRIEEENEIYNLLKQIPQKKGNRLIESKTYNYITKLYNHNSEIDYSLVRFFENQIPTEDYEILKAAQFIISKKNFENLKDLKYKLKKRYGEKGNRIVNLLNAKYFNMLKEVYNHAPENFEKLYRQLVYEGVSTIFVCNYTDIEKELESNISKINNFKLHFRFVHIHGLGKNNVEKIQIFLDHNEEKSDEDPKYIIKIIISKQNIIVIEVII